MLYTRRLKQHFKKFFNYGLEAKRALEVKVMSRSERTKGYLDFLKEYNEAPKLRHVCEND